MWKEGVRCRGHLGLEDLDELELAAALELEALELGQAAVRVEHRIALLDQLALLLAGRQDHGLPHVIVVLRACTTGNIIQMGVDQCMHAC
jgi:hypothetical protein